jgi:hypothetical protein
MTKTENFGGSRKVAHILKGWSLLSTKIPISSRSVENSSVMSHSPAAPPVFTNFPGRIELVFHTKNSMKYRPLHTILKYRFNTPILIFHVQNIGILYRYLRIVCKDWYFILLSVLNTNSILLGFAQIFFPKLLFNGNFVFIQ